MNIDKEKLISYIKKLSVPKILVIGDLAMDEMVCGDVERVSREAPVLILQHTATRPILGAASNAAHNISTLNKGKVSVIGVFGEDYQAEQLSDTFKTAGIDTKYVVRDKTRKTITKTRILGSVTSSITQQIVRIDRQTNTPLSKETEEKVISNIKCAIPEYDMIILSNYHIGTLTENIIKKTIAFARMHNKQIVVDAQRDLGSYRGITSMTPNLPDTQKSVGFALASKEALEKAGDLLLCQTNAEAILITCGADGMFMTQPNKKYTKIPVFNKSEVFDVTGAGDTVTAVYSLALAAGAEPVCAAIISNVAASIVVRQLGCATTTVEELLSAVEKLW